MSDLKVVFAADDEVTSWTRYICFTVADNNYEGKLYWDLDTGYEINLSVGDIETLEKDISAEMNDWLQQLDWDSYDSQLVREAEIKKTLTS